MAGMKMWNGFTVWLWSSAILLLAMMVPYTAGAQSALHDVHRFHKSGKHLFTLDYSEGINAGFSYEGVGFTVYVGALDTDMTLLYRCYRASHQDHFASTDAN